MRREECALTAAHNYLTIHSSLTISIITRFEVLRGLHAKNAKSQLAAFETLCQSLEILPLTDDVVVRAAQLYGKLHQTGRLIGDADILIAATCLQSDCQIVTNNTSHFSRFPELVRRNWLL